MITYYTKFREVLQRDIEQALSHPDPKERPAKLLKEWVNILEELETKIMELDKQAENTDWQQVSPAARRKIEEIIEEDLKAGGFL